MKIARRFGRVPQRNNQSVCAATRRAAAAVVESLEIRRLLSSVVATHTNVARAITAGITADDTGGSYTITVNDNADTLDNPTTDLPNQLGTSITLRDAINAANNAQGTTTIVLAKTTYDFTTVDNNWYGPNALPPIESNITIQGNGATLKRDSSLAQTTAGAFRFFYISGGIATELPLGTLSLQNLTMTNGLAKGGDSLLGGGGGGMGGAIFNQGDTTLSGVTLYNNTALGGSSGDVSLADFSENPQSPVTLHAATGGGGIGQDAPFDNSDTESSGGGFGGDFADGVYGGKGTDQGTGGGFDANGQDDTGGGYSGLGGDSLYGQGLGGDGGSADLYGGATSQGGDFGFGGQIQFTQFPNDTDSGGGGGVGGGGATSDDYASAGGDGGFGGGGGSVSYFFPFAYSNVYSGGNGGFGGGGGAGGTGGPGALDGEKVGHGGFGGGNGASYKADPDSGGGGAGMGGAIFSMYGSLTVVNSTLTANTAKGGDAVDSDYQTDATAGSGYGGAIFNLDGSADIESSTIADNTVTGGQGAATDGSGNGDADGGALYNLAYGSNYDTNAAVTAAATINNSILYGTVGGTNDLVNTEFNGNYVTQSYHLNPPANTGNVASVTGTAPNIIGASTNSPDNQTAVYNDGTPGTATLTLPDVISTDPKLAALADNGGPTKTMALLPGSPAIGAGTPVSGITTDQRGFARPASKPDIGAFQTGGSYTITVNDNADTLDNPATDFPNQLGTSITLRDAINAANNAQGTTTIVLAKTTYDFTTVDNNWYGPDALPAIDSNITLQGNGATLQRDPACAQTTDEAFRFFYVSGGIATELPLGTLTLQNLTLTNGLAKGGDSNAGGGGLGAGGAIFNQGNLTLSGVTLTGNTALGGSSGVDLADGSFGGGGIGQDAQGGGVDGFGVGGGFGGSFPDGIYGGAGDSSGGGGFDAPAAGYTGGGFSGLGGFRPQGTGGDGGSNEGGTDTGGDFGFGGVDGAGGVGGGGGTTYDGGFGGGGGGFDEGAGDNGLPTAGGFGGGGGGPTGEGGAPGPGGFGGGNASPYIGGGGAGMGGAVFSMFGSLTVINSTLTANTAQGGKAEINGNEAGDGGSGYGGAIFNLDGTASITFSTLAANTVTAGTGTVNGSADGGALYNLAYGSNYDTAKAVTAAVTIGDSILAGTVGGTHDLVNQEVDGDYPTGPNADVNTGNTASITTFAPNIVVASSNISGGPNGTATLGTTGFVPGVTNANLGLAPLGSYGGPTQTMALLPGSPAIAAGTPVNGITTDQTGFTRSASTPSIGAYENEGFTIKATGGTPQSTATGTAFATALSVQVLSNNDFLNPAGGVITFTAPSTGASATIAPNPVTLATGGTASTTATANATAGGPYDVTASATGIATPATFVLSNTSPTSRGSIAGSSGPTASSYNLTQLGVFDWIHWGTGQNVSSVDDKSSGGGQISNVSRTSVGSYGAYTDQSRDVIWSDGKPLAKDSGDQSYIWANNATGAGYSFTAPADTTPRTLYIYLGGYDSGGTLTATLSDSSATAYTASFSGSAIYSDLVAITYKAGSASQHLLITYTKAAGVGVIGGSVDLDAAWLGQPLTNLSPVIVTNPRTQTVTAGTNVSFTASATTLATAPPTVQWYLSTNGGTSFTLIPSQTNTTLNIGAATLAESGNEYEAIFTTSAGTAVTSPATLTVTSAPVLGGSLVGSSSKAAASYNYTMLGNTDWIHWGRASTASNVDRKASGGSQISNVVHTTVGSYGAYADPSRDSIWTDGSPTARDTGDTSYIWANNAAGAGYTFTAPADKTTRTLYIYLGGYDSGGTLTATLSDNSATAYTVNFSGTAIYSELVAITYKAGAAGQKLDLSYTKTANVGVLGGSVDLIGAWLA